ncbi:unnamed protein product [Urochloa humidicola]
MEPFWVSGLFMDSPKEVMMVKNPATYGCRQKERAEYTDRCGVQEHVDCKNAAADQDKSTRFLSSMVLAYKAWSGETEFQSKQGQEANCASRPGSRTRPDTSIIVLHLEERNSLRQLRIMETHMTARTHQEALNIEQEYSSMLRTQSNARFLLKKHQSEEEMEALLETPEDIITPVLHNLLMRRRTSSEIERAMAEYFEASTEAIEMCRQLLRDIKNTQSNYQSMDNFLTSFTDSTASTSASAPLALKSFPVTSNPFYTTTQRSFRQIHDKYSSILQSIRSSHRRVARKIKIMKAVKKLSRGLLVAACGGVAAAAIGAASHLVFLGFLIGAAAAGILPIAIKKRIVAKAKKEKRSSKTMSSLLRLQEQLDTAAKGTYVLGQDLDTVSSLVARLSDGIERENDMARCCEERLGEKCSVMEMVNELRKSCSGPRRIAEELEEHVCLFLATICKARVLVIQEISKQI